MAKDWRRWLCGVIAIILLSGFAAAEARAGAWSDYLEIATGIVADDNRRLNAALQPAKSARVKLLVEIRQTGAIKESRVIESSGYEGLDAAALAAIEQLATLPTPPASVYFKQFFTPLVFTYSFEPAPVPALPAQQVSVVAPEDSGEDGETVNAPAPTPDKTVLALQSALAEIGFDPGPVDGFYGPGTAGAIRAFQRDQGLPEDGVATAALLQDVIQATGRRQVEVAAQVEADETAAESEADSETESDEGGFTPPETGAYSLNREIYEDYEYVGDRQIEDY